MDFATAIAQPDRSGGHLFYRGIDVEELVNELDFARVWGLLVDDDPCHPLERPGTLMLPVRSTNGRADLQASLALLAPLVGLQPLIDLELDAARDELARASALGISLVAQSIRGSDRPPVSAWTVADTSSLAEEFLASAFGECDPARARAIDAYWIATAEHGFNASTVAARVVASTGADAGACLSAAVGALSGPLHGGAPARVLEMLDAVEAMGDARSWVRAELDRGQRIMGFGHRIYRAEDPRAKLLRAIARDVGASRYEVAASVERAALSELSARKPDRVLATNVEYWAAILLDHAGIPADFFTSVFACARMAGWSAHILEQRRSGRLIRPAGRYIGTPPRPLATAGG